MSINWTILCWIFLCAKLKNHKKLWTKNIWKKNYFWLYSPSQLKFIIILWLWNAPSRWPYRNKKKFSMHSLYNQGQILEFISVFGYSLRAICEKRELIPFSFLTNITCVYVYTLFLVVQLTTSEDGEIERELIACTSVLSAIKKRHEKLRLTVKWTLIIFYPCFFSLLLFYRDKFNWNRLQPS